MTTTPGPAERVRKRLLRWAKDTGLRQNPPGYAERLEENLFLPPYPETEKEFGAGKGAELEEKMRALHSSSALVCNMFDYWRHRDRFPMTSALELPTGRYSLRFEVPLKTGLRGTAPHLDVALIGRAARVFIESKFLEPYGREPSDVPFQDSYFSENRIWEDLPKCRILAGKLSQDPGFYRYLDAPQLIKHLLGLSRNRGRDFQLMYLWYDVGGAEAGRHREEAMDFRRHLDPWIRYEARTHQDVMKYFRQGYGEMHARWVGYMNSRYFDGEDRS